MARAVEVFPDQFGVIALQDHVVAAEGEADVGECPDPPVLPLQVLGAELRPGDGGATQLGVVPLEGLTVVVPVIVGSQLAEHLTGEIPGQLRLRRLGQQSLDDLLALG